MDIKLTPSIPATKVDNITDTETNSPIQIKTSPPITTAKDSSPTTPKYDSVSILLDN